MAPDSTTIQTNVNPSPWGTGPVSLQTDSKTLFQVALPNTLPVSIVTMEPSYPLLPLECTHTLFFSPLKSFLVSCHLFESPQSFSQFTSIQLRWSYWHGCTQYYIVSIVSVTVTNNNSPKKDGNQERLWVVVKRWLQRLKFMTNWSISCLTPSSDWVIS